MTLIFIFPEKRILGVFHEFYTVYHGNQLRPKRLLNDPYGLGVQAHAKSRNPLIVQGFSLTQYLAKLYD